MSTEPVRDVEVLCPPLAFVGREHDAVPVHLEPAGADGTPQRHAAGSVQHVGGSPAINLRFKEFSHQLYGI